MLLVLAKEKQIKNFTIAIPTNHDLDSVVLAE
jgi:hypothetical protein